MKSQLPVEKFKRSASVDEVITSKPSFMEKWAVMIFASIVGVMLMSTRFVKYPDVIHTTAMLTSTKAPVEIMSKISGSIEKIFVNNGDSVRTGQVIAQLQSLANYDKVVHLKDFLNNMMEHFPDSLFKTRLPRQMANDMDLGELEPLYKTFISAWQKYIDIELGGQMNKGNKDVLLRQTDMQLALQKLYLAVSDWVDLHTIYADETGKILFYKAIGEKTYLQAKQSIGHIDIGQKELYAQMYLPKANLSKIHVGQKVSVRLFAYPHEDYGSVKGEIVFVSEICSDTGFFAEARLIDGLTTTHKVTIPFKWGMKGEAFIFTKESTLFQRLHNGITLVFEK